MTIPARPPVSDSRFWLIYGAKFDFWSKFLNFQKFALNPKNRRIAGVVKFFGTFFEEGLGRSFVSVSFFSIRSRFVGATGRK